MMPLAAQLTPGAGQVEKKFQHVNTKSKKSARPGQFKAWKPLILTRPAYDKTLGKLVPGPGNAQSIRPHAGPSGGLLRRANLCQLSGRNCRSAFAPRHPVAEWIEGKACPYKLCSDYCRFPTPALFVEHRRGGSLARGLKRL